MLTEPIEIEIISKARQANVRDPLRNRQPFYHILDDFLYGESLRGALVLDLGPGQFDLGEILRAHGAEVEAIDNDPAVLELGTHRGHRCIEGDIASIHAIETGATYDGVFCKFSCNSVPLATNPADLQRFVDALVALCKPGGWCWIAPWNGGHQNYTEEALQRFSDLELSVFRDHGFLAYELTEEQSIRYGVHGTTLNRRLFTLRLPSPPHLQVLNGSLPPAPAPPSKSDPKPAKPPASSPAAEAAPLPKTAPSPKPGFLRKLKRSIHKRLPSKQ
jgi:SAM-dependent methyltransferase